MVLEKVLSFCTRFRPLKVPIQILPRLSSQQDHKIRRYAMGSSSHFAGSRCSSVFTRKSPFQLRSTVRLHCPGKYWWYFLSDGVVSRCSSIFRQPPSLVVLSTCVLCLWTCRISMFFSLPSGSKIKVISFHSLAIFSFFSMKVDFIIYAIIDVYLAGGWWSVG